MRISCDARKALRDRLLNHDCLIAQTHVEISLPGPDVGVARGGCWHPSEGTFKRDADGHVDQGGFGRLEVCFSSLAAFIPPIACETI